MNLSSFLQFFSQFLIFVFIFITAQNSVKTTSNLLHLRKQFFQMMLLIMGVFACKYISLFSINQKLVEVPDSFKFQIGVMIFINLLPFILKMIGAKKERLVYLALLAALAYSI